MPPTCHPIHILRVDRPNNGFDNLTATLDAATWGAGLAIGEGTGRIYIVEPTGPIEDDPI